ncbi:hypothetical protein COCON_G00223380 [Conger conger]|uniref:Uncharacterized protein n=1 Tax=Conger conger TaxID=82655 RepID=A0A9Q1CWB0_CONCO|nr:hypothetical protein COCON_G00223380 [Conger conger]
MVRSAAGLLKVGVASGQAVHALRQGTTKSCAASEEREPGDDCQKGSVVPEFSEMTGGSSHSASPSIFNHIIYGLPNLVLT